MKSILINFLATLALAQAQSCNQVLTERDGVISSPGYPDDYPANSDCYWEFVRPDDVECVLFTVEDFVVPSPNEVTCPGDHFVLESCGSWWNVAPERYYCGDYTEYLDSGRSFNLVQHYQINATSFRVGFHSDSQNQARGFLMQYKMLNAQQCKEWGSPGYNKIEVDGDKVDCVGILRDVAGTFNSPGFPNPYPSDTACAYGFRRPSKEYCGVLIRSNKFDLEERDSGTCYDYIGMPGCAKSCGSKTSPEIYFYEYQKDADMLFLQFRSDFSTEGRGFRMAYQQVTDCFNPHQPECPNDQLNPYSTPSECPNAEYHECKSNEECDNGQICCFDGCLRACKDPVESVRRRKRRQALDALLEGVNVNNASRAFPNSIPHFPVPTSPLHVLDPESVPMPEI